MFLRIYSLLRNEIRKYPKTQKFLRKLYLYTRYYIKSDLKFRISLSPGISITSVENWAGFQSLPGATFFGYYDKSPWSQDGNAYLCHFASNHEVLIYVLNKGESSPLLLDRTITWNYQQGAMLQWIPNGNNNLVVYNTIQSSLLGCCIQDIVTKKKKFINWPIQSIHPNGENAVSLNYTRLTTMNPEYSYNCDVSNFSSNMPPSEDGLWYISLFGGTSKLLISLETLINFSYRPCIANANHGINHAMFSPNGKKIVFIHRWLTKNFSRYSRLYAINTNGEKLKIILDDDFVSHYCWLDNNHLFVYAATKSEGARYYQINVDDGNIEIIGKNILDSYGDGHPNLSPDGSWIVSDTYPDASRVRRLLLWNIAEKRLVIVGNFYSPVTMENGARCDLHPRWHPYEYKLSIDSGHEGIRKTYIVDVSKIVKDIQC